MANEVTVWNKVMSTAMNMPGVKVDRDEFLSKELRPYCTSDELSKALINPVKVISKERIEHLANACINNHTTKVTAISAAAGIPGGLAMAATIPADMAQYYWHTFVLAQKLAYLYGFPDLRDEDGNLSETAQDMLTLFVGVMMGAAAANNAIKNISKAFAVQVVKRLPQQALTKTVYYPIIKQVAKWIGIRLTKDGFAKGVGKAIPILGGVLSGVLTFATFKPSAKRLQSKLEEQMDDLADLDVNDESLFDNYEDVSTDSDMSTDGEPSNVSEKIILQFIINLAKVGKMSSEKEDFISNEIETSSLSDDEQLELAKAINGTQQFIIDFAPIKNDEANAAVLIEKAVSLLELESKIGLAEKLYLKKVAKQLGFSSEDIEEALKI